MAVFPAFIHTMEIFANAEFPLARYSACTNAKGTLNGSYGEGEPENVNFESVRKAHQPERACKLMDLMHRRIGPSMEICANSQLPLARYIVCTNARGI